ncbi:unnamed protein product [Durusdinium trenchii]|uniref:Uncharacterized protein n=2 Tax=Durusdinium trenchii TaxID=1381693 RepID=A0ABP0NB06_9DINO
MCRWEPPGMHVKDGPHTYATHCGWSSPTVIGLMAFGATRTYHIHGIPWYFGRGRREVVVVDLPLREGMLVALGGPLREKWLYAQPRDEEMKSERIQLTLQFHADLEVKKGTDLRVAATWTEDAEPVWEVSPPGRWRKGRTTTAESTKSAVRDSFRCGFLPVLWWRRKDPDRVANFDPATVQSLAAVSGERFGAELKRCLEIQTRTPRFRQRLLYQGREVSRATWDLTVPQELQLVILSVRGGNARALVDATERGDLHSVQKVLEDLQDPNEEDIVDEYEARLPLLIASTGGFLQIVECLLSANADVNRCDRVERRTALQAASGFGRVMIVERLLSAAANVNQADSFGRTALWVGVAGRCLKVVQLLVAQRADLNLGAEAIEEDFNEDDGITPLSLAAENGSLRILRFLIRSRANLNKADQEGRSPLWFAAAVGQPQCALALLKAGCNRDQMSRDGKTPLHMASGHHDASMVRCLVEHGADVEMPDNVGRTPQDLVKHAAKQGYMAGGKKKELLSALGGGGPDHMTRLEAVKMVQPQGRSVLILRVFNHGVQAGDMGSFADSGDMGTPSEEPLYLVTLVMLLEGAERIECKRGG